MAHPVIRTFEDVPSNAPFRFDLTVPGARPRDPELVKADIRQAVQGGASWVQFDLPDPAGHPALEDILWEVDASGARARMTSLGRTLGERGVLERMRNAGLAQLELVAYGATDATHDGIVGGTGAFAALLEALDVASRLNSLRVSVRVVLLKENHTEIGDLIARVRDQADRVDLVRLSALTRERPLLAAHGVARRDALAAVQAAWEAARVVHLELETSAFSTWPEIPVPSDVPLQPADRSLLELLRANVPVPSVLNGTWATPADGDVSGVYHAVESSRSLAELGLQLAAYGCPALDLPPAMGGMGLDVRPDADPEREPIPLRRIDGVPALLARTFDALDTRPLPAWAGTGAGKRAAVVAGFATDNVLALSTLPGLAAALAREGLQTTLHSVWQAPFNPYDRQTPLPEDALAPSTDPERPGWRYPDEAADALATVPARYAHARRQSPAWLASLDLSGQDLVVVPGFDNALAVLDNETLPADARVVIPDFHLMTGLGAWHARWLPSGARSMDGGWWPDERIEVHALYPRYVRAYWRAGVPLRQVSWRPYPIHTGHFPPGPPVTSCTTIFAGGAHQRDWQTLARAMAQLGDRPHPLVLHTREAVPSPLQSHGEVRLLHFYEAIANSRFVVLPLDADPRKPAGISVISMALAAGRPVIASSTLATQDHLRHGHDAILVPPGRPDALAKAIARLDEDDALLERLAAGARSASRTVSVAAWARMLAHGAPPQACYTLGEAMAGPYHAWPA